MSLWIVIIIFGYLSVSKVSKPYSDLGLCNLSSRGIASHQADGSRPVGLCNDPINKQLCNITYYCMEYWIQGRVYCFCWVFCQTICCYRLPAGLWTSFVHAPAAQELPFKNLVHVVHAFSPARVRDTTLARSYCSMRNLVQCSSVCPFVTSRCCIETIEWILCTMDSTSLGACRRPKYDATNMTQQGR